MHHACTEMTVNATNAGSRFTLRTFLAHGIFPDPRSTIYASGSLTQNKDSETIRRRFFHQSGETTASGRWSSVKRSFGRSKRDSIGRKITEVSGKNERPGKTVSQNHGAGIGKIHFRRPVFDEIENGRESG